MTASPEASAAPPVLSRTLDRAGMWSAVVSRGKTLRLTDLEGGANAGMLLYNADLPVERYNMPDTLKGQHTFHLRHPFCLHSDMGRVLASITADSAGWHDTVCGCSDARLVEARFGSRTYQEARNEFYRNGLECFLIELAKWGLGRRDLVPNVNFFSKAAADEGGRLTYVPGHSRPGGFVDLRFEMNTLVVVNTCQHPLDPGPYRAAPVRLEVFPPRSVPPDDPCRNSCPENVRAFENTEAYWTLRAG